MIALPILATVPMPAALFMGLGLLLFLGVACRFRRGHW